MSDATKAVFLSYAREDSVATRCGLDCDDGSVDLIAKPAGQRRENPAEFASNFR